MRRSKGWCIGATPIGDPGACINLVTGCKSTQQYWASQKLKGSYIRQYTLCLQCDKQQVLEIGILAQVQKVKGLRK